MCDFLLIKAPHDADRAALRGARVCLRDWTDTPPGRFLNPGAGERAWMVARPDCSCGFRAPGGDIATPLTAFLEPLCERFGVVECLWIELDGSAESWKPGAGSRPVSATDAHALLVAPFDRVIRFASLRRERPTGRRHG